jgi:hypothetical protein
MTTGNLIGIAISFRYSYLYPIVSKRIPCSSVNEIKRAKIELQLNNTYPNQASVPLKSNNYYPKHASTLLKPNNTCSKHLSALLK